MGQLIEVKCTNCDYSAIFMTGTGLADNSLNDVAARFKEDIAKHILHISQCFTIENYQYEKKIAFCSHCQSLKSIPVISVEYNKNSRFNYGFVCEKCGNDYIFISPLHEVCNQKCPQCKTGGLESCGFGLWD